MSNETFKQEKLTDFTVIRNAIFKDTRLSAKVVGVACKLLSLPPTWEYSVKGLVTLFSDGEASIRNALTELEEAGYLRRERIREGGKLGKCIYVITDALDLEKPNVENPHVVNPVVENHAQYNTKESNTKELNTKELDIRESRSSGRRTRFTPPTVEEVAQYINEQGLHINAEMFVDYYNSNGWKVGRSPMKDFKATLRNWERRRKQNEGNKAPKNPFMEMLKDGMFDG